MQLTAFKFLTTTLNKLYFNNMNATELQLNTVYNYACSNSQLKVKYTGMTKKGNYTFIATEGQYKGVKRSLSAKAVKYYIEEVEA